MSDSIELIADATFGLRVKIGDHVEQDQQLGLKYGSQDLLRSPAYGTVQDVTFDSDGHRFIITITIQV